MALDVKGATRGIGILWNLDQVSLSNFVAFKNTLSTHFHVFSIVVKGVLLNVYGPFQLAEKPKFL